MHLTLDLERSGRDRSSEAAVAADGPIIPLLESFIKALYSRKYINGSAQWQAGVLLGGLPALTALNSDQYNEGAFIRGDGRRVPPNSSALTAGPEGRILQEDP